MNKKTSRKTGRDGDGVGGVRTPGVSSRNRDNQNGHWEGGGDPSVAGKREESEDTRISGKNNKRHLYRNLLAPVRDSCFGEGPLTTGPENSNAERQTSLGTQNCSCFTKANLGTSNNDRDGQKDVYTSG